MFYKAFFIAFFFYDPRADLLYCIREFGSLPIPRPNTSHPDGAVTSLRGDGCARA